MPAPAAQQLAIDDLAVAYPGGARVLDGLSLSLERGEIGCLVGSSGCGKTTLLRAIAGFLPVAAGTIEIDGLVVSGPHFTAPPEKRGVGLVFQDYALFPHLTVADNIAFGLRALRGAARSDRVDGDARAGRTDCGGEPLSARTVRRPATASRARACALRRARPCC